MEPDARVSTRAAYAEPQAVPECDGSAAYAAVADVEPDTRLSARAVHVESKVAPAWDGGAVASAAHVDAAARPQWLAKDSARAAYVEPQDPSARDWDDSGSVSRSERGTEGSTPAASVEPDARWEWEADASATHTPAAHVGAEVGAEPDAPQRDNSGSESQGSAPADSVEPQDHPVGHGGHPHSGIPAPVWDVSVPAGVGGVVPTRASVTFDSHRWSPLIVGEATHEIPVHLLFRDDEATGPVAGRPRARRAPVVPAPVLAPAASSRPATPVDTKLVERPGPTLPGWTAALAGVAALFGCVVVLWWVGAVPDALTEMFGLGSNPYNGIGIGMWALLTVAVSITLFAFGGLGRGRVGHAWVLTLFGEYRGSVRRTGLLWVSPLLLRRRVDVRLRHWRSEPMPAVDANGTALRVVVLVVWRVRDTVRAALGVRDHEEYLREQVEAAMARVLSQLPADAFHEAAPTLRNAEAVGEALTRMLSAECRPVGLDVFSAQPTRIEYAPEISAAMQRSRIAAIDARHRDTVLTSVVDAVDDTVHRLTSRGLVELDDYERKVLVKDLTVAFYTGRHGLNEGN
ncbi:membrane protease subunit [Streptomyces sp. 4R-3d]|nr:membrane protease subunit [Streptomyces sp. 4R-3d]